MQVQIEKPKQIRQFKIGIVGPSKPQWKNPEQYAMMQRWIRHLIKAYQTGHKPIILKEGEAPYPSPCGFGIGEVFDNELIIVSGHCPVGEEQSYCITCDCWVSLPYGASLHIGHKLIKVYDQGGIDTETEIIAAQLGVKTEIYPAPAMQWQDKVLFTDGFHKAIAKGSYSRNIQIAEAVNILFCLIPYQKDSACSHHSQDPEGRKEHLNHPNNGGCWTRQYAAKLGKETHLVVIT